MSFEKAWGYKIHQEMGKLQTGASPQNTKEPPLQPEHPLLQRTYNDYVLCTCRVSASIVNWLYKNKQTTWDSKDFPFSPTKRLERFRKYGCNSRFSETSRSCVSNVFRSCGTGQSASEQQRGQCPDGAKVHSLRRYGWVHRIWTLTNMKYMGLSENRVYSQWNSHLIGIMIIDHWV